MAYIVLFIAFNLSVLFYLICLWHAPTLTALISLPFFLNALLRNR